MMAQLKMSMMFNNNDSSTNGSVNCTRTTNQNVYNSRKSVHTKVLLCNPMATLPKHGTNDINNSKAQRKNAGKFVRVGHSLHH